MEPIDQQFWEDFQHLKKENIVLRQSENRLNEIRSRYHAVMSAGEELTAILDGDGVFLEMNNTGLKLLGLEERSIIGKNAGDVFPEARTAVVGDYAADVVRHGKPVRFSWFVRRLQGSPLLFKALMEPVYDTAGSITSAILITRNISDIEVIREELNQVVEIVSKLQQRLDRFSG